MAATYTGPSSILDELNAAGSRDLVKREDKKNYAEMLSRALATKVANGLRPSFPGILPDQMGARQESRARTSKGVKKLDVNYSTPELGLGLGVSIKTINFPDPGTARYTKNYTRVDNELRAEAHDYHERQPYAVMVALIFLPVDSCEDGRKGHPSSFGNAAQHFQTRSGRAKPTDPEGLFEGIFIGLYEPSGEGIGDIVFFDVTGKPPMQGKPTRSLTFDEVIVAITAIYDRRNNPPKEWAEETD
jgi:hypothetical protein